MTNKEYPALVVALYNRLEPAERVLNSLNEAIYPADNIQLVISIDTDGHNKNIYEYANSFNWKHGEKRVIFHENNLGIREHFNFCGDLTYEYDKVIFIEDD
jgi:GT2 family glycosyltransferase